VSAAAPKGSAEDKPSHAVETNLIERYHQAVQVEPSMRIAEIESAVRAAINPLSLLVIDESHLHRGHAGARPFGQSHYRLVAVSDAFAGKSRVERQRLVHEALGQALGEAIHALSMTLHSAAEAEHRS
jgi:BolA family transcriptional regulator, general stress-responsive regulator